MTSRTKSKSTRNRTSEPSIDDNDSKSSNTIPLNLPFTITEKIFFGTTCFIAIYEIMFWMIFDYPFTLHSYKETPIYVLGISATLNSIPHLFCGTYGLLYITRSYRSAALLLVTKYKQQKQLKNIKSEKDRQTMIAKHERELQKLPMYEKGGGLRFSFYVLYSSLFTLMQVYFWWLPYAFGIVTDQRFEKMQKKMNGIVSILPKNDKYLVPSAEHTILFPMSILSWMLAVRLFLKYRPVIITQVRTSASNYALLASFSGLICYLPTSMATVQIKSVGKDGAEIIETQYDFGAAIVAALLIAINISFFIALFRAPNYKKAVTSVEKKKQ